MPRPRSVAGEPRYVLTDQGRAAIDQLPLCICDVRLVGILFACPDCGTVMGSIKDATKPRAQRWTYGKRA